MGIMEIFAIFSGKLLANSFAEKIASIKAVDLSQTTPDFQYKSQNTIYFWRRADWHSFYTLTKTPVYIYLAGRMDTIISFILIGTEDTYYHYNVDFRWAYLDNSWQLQGKSRLSDTSNMIVFEARNIFSLQQ